MHKAPAGALCIVPSVNQRPANGGHDKFIVNGRTGGQTQTASPAFIREEQPFIAGVLRRLPGVQPASLCCLTFVVHFSVPLSVFDSPDCAVTTQLLLSQFSCPGSIRQTRCNCLRLTAAFPETMVSRQKSTFC
uniref:Uncharacterized protein n=2 Tax=Klebsiella pneumoniae TaxID=573 RepID=R4WN78_KLEPN|nr:hypothetical protein KPX_B0127 [Klebsiella pneumoniae subsp. pneumoniae KPX]